MLWAGFQDTTCVRHTHFLDYQNTCMRKWDVCFPHNNFYYPAQQGRHSDLFLGAYALFMASEVLPLFDCTSEWVSEVLGQFWSQYIAVRKGCRQQKYCSSNIKSQLFLVSTREKNMFSKQTIRILE